MDPAAIGAIVAGPGNIFGTWYSNRANRQEAEKNRAFQREMSNSQWQRTVADMEAAGINPALAYSRGPNSSPGGSLAAPQQDMLGPGISTAMQAIRMKKDLKLLDEQIRNVKENTRSTYEENRWKKFVNDWRLTTTGGPLDGRPGVEAKPRQPGLVELEQQLAAGRLSNLLTGENVNYTKLRGMMINVPGQALNMITPEMLIAAVVGREFLNKIPSIRIGKR